MTDVPEFGSVIGTSLAEKLSQSSDEQTPHVLQECFTALMTCDPAVVQEKLQTLVQRLENSSKFFARFYSMNIPSLNAIHVM